MYVRMAEVSQALKDVGLVSGCRVKRGRGLVGWEGGLQGERYG